MSSQVSHRMLGRSAAGKLAARIEGRKISGVENRMA